MQVYVYKLPSLPGANSRGYSVTDQPLTPPSSAKSPFFGSAGLAATGSAEYIYVGAPVAPQQTSQLTSIYGNSAVFVYAVSCIPMKTPPFCVCGELHPYMKTPFLFVFAVSVVPLL